MGTKRYITLLTGVFCFLAACGSSEPGDDPGQDPVTPPEPPVEQGDFVRISAGTFTMGSPADERWRETDEVQHEVTLHSYLIAKQEVTQEEYRAVTGTNPSHHQGDNRPVEMVSWYDAVRYCNALSELEGLTAAYTIEGVQVTWNREADGYRLPTEAEWEYACRAGTTSPFSTERNITVEQSNWYSSYPYIEGEGGGAYRRQTVEADEFEPNAWGLFNMHGNVSEWCWDRYGAYGTQPQTDPAGPETGRNRVARGGGWYDYAKHVRSAYRSVAPPDYTDYKRGFRVARNAD